MLCFVLLVFRRNRVSISLFIYLLVYVFWWCNVYVCMHVYMHTNMEIKTLAL